MLPRLSLQGTENNRDNRIVLPSFAPVPVAAYLLQNWNRIDNHLSAPTQSLLQKWLRDKYNIDLQPYLILCKNNTIEVKQEKESKEYAYMLFIEGILNDNYTIVAFNSYEEALEVGLLEALKLITI